ncbi:MAG: hypothetical protein KC619_02720 [Myxococcales bacterium]|nr:hypothetical protein [Myxococcales bacterium]
MLRAVRSRQRSTDRSTDSATIPSTSLDGRGWWLVFVGWGLAGCASGSPLADGGTSFPDAERPPTTVVDGTWLDDVELPAPLAPLPTHVPADVGDLETHDTCERCHRNVEGDPSMRDEAERPIAPDDLWRASMMGLSGRDPYWLAVLSHELEENPEATTYVQHVCTRCHAPAASATLTPDTPIPFDELVGETTPLGHLARDGVTCSLCHRLADAGLGEEASFVGGFVVEDLHEIYGPHEDPDGSAMITATGYGPVYAPHFGRSAVCGSCHTVITRALDETGAFAGPPFPEQTPYLEWRNSVFVDEGPSPGPEARGCPSCHVPTTSEDGAPIMTAIASNVPTLAERAPYGRHVFFGGNAYMLGLAAENLDWVGADVSGDALGAASARTEDNLRASATVALAATVDGDRLEATVTIENRTGHRLPTGYPSRRVFVRFTVEDGTGVILWQSGRTHAHGGFIDRAGARLDYPGAYQPHFDVISREDQIQVYEGVLGDLDGEPTRSLLRAAGYLKDNRILPRGWDAGHADAAYTSPIGTAADASFGPGRDEVHYVVRLPEGAALVRAELVYQAIPAPAVEHLFDRPTPATARFDAMRRARPDRGRIIAAAEQPLP